MQLYFIKNNIFFKFERKISYFLWFFIFIIVTYILKVCLFENILILEIIALIKE